MSASVTHAETYTFVTEWGSEVRDENFKEPLGVAVDSLGNIYVADTGNQCIKKFDSSGKFIIKWGSEGTGNGQFYGASDVAVDSLGNVYVADTSNSRVQKFDSDGNYINQWGSSGSGNGQFANPNGIAVDSLGNVYVADTSNSRIQKFDSEGNYVNQWGSSGSGNGQFANPIGVVVDSLGNVYVVEMDNNRIQKFSSSGDFITKIGSEWSFPGSGSGDGQFTSPSGIAVDSSGNIYVVDTGNHRVQKFDSNGNFITKWGFYDIGNGQFREPWGIAVDSSSNVYVAERMNARVQKFDSNGTFIFKFGSISGGDGQLYYPMGVDVDSSGNVYVTDTNNNRVQKFDSSGKFITKWGSYGIGDDQFDSPICIAVDSSGKVYVADFGNKRIQKFDSKGNFIAKWSSFGTNFAIDSSDNVYVVSGFEISMYDNSGKYIRSWASPDWYMDPEGSAYSPICVAVDSSGNVYAADTQCCIQKLDSSGKFITKWGSYGIGNGLFLNPSGISIDSSDNVYVADTDNHRIQKFDSNGNFITKWGSEGSNEGQFNKPKSIIVDSSGSVYVADTYNHRIQKFALEKPSLIKPIADFSASPTSGNSPLKVQFTDNSTGNPTSWNWNFGDGETSVEKSPEHTYNSAGTYTVNLTVSNANGTDSKIATITVLEKPVSALLVANFSSNVTQGYAPLSVQFTDLSENAASINWDFGDGVNSTEKNPIHTYSGAGIYTVNLTASIANGTDFKLATITVSEKSAPVLPVANFSTDVSEGYAPLTVQFTDKSENATGCNWDFGDGTYSTEQNPIHTYSIAGNYTVNLTASNKNGTASTISTIIVRKQPAVLPVADFRSDVTAGCAPLTVQFTDLSKYAAGWNWDFGDGTSSTEQNPMHTYRAVGNYTVTLTVNNEAGTDTEKKANYINAKPVSSKLIAAFYASPTSGDASLKVAFTDRSTGSPTSWKWSFGDGTYSTAKNPVHTYSKAGKYIVSLTVKNSKGSNTVTKSNYINVVNKIKAPVATFSASPTSGNAQLKVAFTDRSKGKPTSWKWSFGDGTYSTAKNPVHTYSKTGKYTVSLTVKNAMGKSTVTGFDYIKVAPSLKAPVAAFSASPTSGKAQLKVQFTDRSAGSPTYRKWNFGDKSTSTARNPVHKYAKAGKYTVSLTVKNAAGKNMATKSGYIIVK